MRISLLGLIGSLWGLVLCSLNGGGWLLGFNSSENPAWLFTVFSVLAVAYLAAAAVSVFDTEWRAMVLGFVSVATLALAAFVGSFELLPFVLPASVPLLAASIASFREFG